MLRVLILLALALSCSKAHDAQEGVKAPVLPHQEDCIITNTCDAHVDKTDGEGGDEGDGTVDNTSGEGGDDNTSDGTKILDKLIAKTPKEYKVTSGSNTYARVKIYFNKVDDSIFSLEVAFTALSGVNKKRHIDKYKGDVLKHCNENEVRKFSRYYYCYKYHELVVKLSSGSTSGEHSNPEYLGAATDAIGKNGSYTIPIKIDMKSGNSFRLRFNVPIAALNDGSLAKIFDVTTWSPNAKVWRKFTADDSEEASAAVKP